MTTHRMAQLPQFDFSRSIGDDSVHRKTIEEICPESQMDKWPMDLPVSHPSVVANQRLVPWPHMIGPLCSKVRVNNDGPLINSIEEWRTTTIHFNISTIGSSPFNGPMKKSFGSLGVTI